MPMVGASLRGIPASYVSKIITSEVSRRIGILTSVKVGNANLQFREGKPPTSSNTAIVLNRGASYHRTELVDRARCNGSGLCKTGVAATLLAAGLEYGISACCSQVRRLVEAR